MDHMRKDSTKYLAAPILGLVLFVAFALEAPPVSAQDDALMAMSQQFREVVEEVQPAVVNVNSIRVVTKSDVQRRQQMPENNPFREFFGDDFFHRFFGPGQPQQEGKYPLGLGSGVIVDEKGYVLTNYHVVRNADEVTVTLSDKREFDAEVVGTDDKTEVAVLKIEGEDLPVARLGDSDAAQVGDWVLAIGNPFGLSQTVTAGIISAKGRANMGIADYEDFIQTDAAINPGNSGGPLVNLRGQVIGINTAILSRTGNYAGVGFAIPINMAQAVMDELITKGKVTRGHLGVWIQDLNEELAETFGVNENKGALVTDVIKDSPAEEAGIERGDVIIEFDGKQVEDSTRLRNIVAATNPDTEVEVTVMRDGKPKTLTVKIGTLTSTESEETVLTGLGLSVEKLTPEKAEELGVEEPAGVAVTEVNPGSSAAQAGIRPGDVIVEVDRETIKSVADFEKALEENTDEGVLLLVRRGQGARYVVLPTEKE
jgi:serine protease Do